LAMRCRVRHAVAQRELGDEEQFRLSVKYAEFGVPFAVP